MTARQIHISKKLELREAGRCPECLRYLGKNEKDLTVDWCNNCHVSYPDNLRVKGATNNGKNNLSRRPRALADALKNTKPIIESAASLARAAASIMASTGHSVKGK